MPLPLIVIRIDVFEPSIWCKDIGFAISIDIRDPHSVAVLLLAAEVMNLGLLGGKINPKQSGMVVVSEHQVGLAIPVDVTHRAAFGVVAVGNEVPLPHHAGPLGVFVPP